MSKHTPGPWGRATVAGKNPRNASTIYSRSTNRTVCSIYLNDGEDRANAALIAAAPDLLEALVMLLDGHSSPGTFRMEQASIDKSLAAIDKALHGSTQAGIRAMARNSKAEA